MPNKNVTVTAHTGCEGTKDNSLEAIRKGYDCKADIVEFDINYLSDGTPVLSHDAPEGECPTLDEAFALVGTLGGLKVNVDLKSVSNIKEVYALAVKHGIADRIFYTGVEEKDVQTVKTETPKVEYYLNTKVSRLRKRSKKYLTSLAEKVENSGAVGINMRYKVLTNELLDVFSKKGLLVSVWTVNSEDALKKVFALSPDNVTTRIPSVAVKIKDNL